MNPNDPDLTLGVEFFMKPVEMPAKSKAAGRPIFEDREMVRIAFPGDSKREHVAPAHEVHYHSGQRCQMTYAERFADSYRRFKDENSDQIVGTPIGQLPFLTEARRAELKVVGIKTAEHLAGLPDVTIKKMGMGIRDLVTQAQAFLKSAEGTSHVAAMQAQIDELKARLAGKTAPSETPDAFAGMERDDLFNMATDAGLEPRANASLDSLKAMLMDAAKKKEAA
jgi:hypothetical protein